MSSLVVHLDPSRPSDSPGLVPALPDPAEGGATRPLGQILLEHGLIDAAGLMAGLQRKASSFGRLGENLVELGLITEEAVLECLAEQLPAAAGGEAQSDKPKASALLDVDISAEARAAVPIALLLKHRAMPLLLNAEKKELTLAMADVHDHPAIKELEFATTRRIRAVAADYGIILALWEKHYGLSREEIRKRHLSFVRDLKFPINAMMNEQSVAKLVENLLTKAVAVGATDIHFDHFEDEVVVRFRLDGLLYTVLSLPTDVYPRVLSRIKILANLDIAEHRLTQDGHITITGLKDQPIELRVAVFPVYGGERVAIRVQDHCRFDFSLDHLGILRDDQTRFRRELSRPNGLALFTGPMGSGKTTTLYSVLHESRDASRNVMTIEDPIEFKFKWIAQSQVSEKTGFTFASALRAMLRQDANVMMVGEIRDEETAEIAVRAALTGHLVIATVHTNDAVTAIARLRDMGIKPFLIASGLNLAVAQRLVRKVCPRCRVPDQPNPRTLLRLGFTPSEIEKATFVRGTGCTSCNFTGYHGRVGIFEVLTVSEKLREMIANGATTAELRKRARKDGMVPLGIAGLEQARAGVTTVEEVIRHTALGE
ncbi:MAG: ATPase, T2SS/T4P/T4SS family [bacterium]